MEGVATTVFEELTQYFDANDWKKDPVHGRIIAVGLDSSEESTKAFYWAITNFITVADPEKIQNKLVLLTCIPENSSAGNSARLHGFLKSQLEKARLSIGHSVPLRAILLRGDPRDKICDAVEALNADVLVVGTRGYGAVKRAMLGSVSDYLSKNSHCPCLIVK
ncbi:hypothetical protein HK100_010989 [Physocladia obscura]|uniref:UspA domain-containing protein n=1 Tax=Physocladia obscura TaxID=109957 RepID=A0AAD5T377_9FUNG|nr:hypothetical protein HK100_010989 [Physocladia obscura]